MKYICPLIVVEDVKKARYFYETILGQKVKSDFGENITFHGDFAIHQKDHFQKLINGAPIKKGSHCFELYFEDNDLESIVRRLKDNDIEFVHEIVEQPWKQRVVRFYDYDKNIIEVGERMEYVAYRLYRENYSTEDICEITYLSREAVIKAIEEYTG